MDDGQHNDAIPANQFRLVRLEKADPPACETSGEWYRYTIEHKASSINGLRSGTLRSVKEHLEEYVKKLNVRAAYGYSAYATRKVNK